MSSASRDQEARDSCRQMVMTIFQDICPEYLEQVAEQWHYHANAVAEYIVDQEQSGKKYPRQQQKKDLKRKRSENEEVIEEMRDARCKYDNGGGKADEPTQMEKNGM